MYIQGKDKAKKNDYIKITVKTAEAIREYLTVRNVYKIFASPLFVSHLTHNTESKMTWKHK